MRPFFNRTWDVIIWSYDNELWDCKKFHSFSFRVKTYRIPIICLFEKTDFCYYSDSGNVMMTVIDGCLLKYHALLTKSPKMVQSWEVYLLLHCNTSSYTLLVTKTWPSISSRAIIRIVLIPCVRITQKLNIQDWGNNRPANQGIAAMATMSCSLMRRIFSSAS